MLSLHNRWPFRISDSFVGVAGILSYPVPVKPFWLTSGPVEITAAFGAIWLTGFSFRKPVNPRLATH